MNWNRLCLRRILPIFLFSLCFTFVATGKLSFENNQYRLKYEITSSDRHVQVKIISINKEKIDQYSPTQGNSKGDIVIHKKLPTDYKLDVKWTACDVASCQEAVKSTFETPYYTVDKCKLYVTQNKPKSFLVCY